MIKHTYDCTKNQHSYLKYWSSLHLEQFKTIYFLLQVKHYKRLTSLNVEDEALGSLDNIQPGDCIVCFSKNDIYSVSRAIEDR